MSILTPILVFSILIKSYNSPLLLAACSFVLYLLLSSSLSLILFLNFIFIDNSIEVNDVNVI